MQFNRIRLSGFKSFVDPTELFIEPGLTGVVGPNGCGKSNLLEALKWVMGENSAKRMRGEMMDDVIFSGTERRTARNLAEVTLLLDNSDRKAPARFNDSDELEVSRRIERESGSAYRINGEEVRAKDVQLLFADAATGAHSPALVSQGKVSSFINAKPQERRLILEEAAGITGLHSRRKEAEQRLRAAENNLERLDDIMGQMEVQAGNLKRQARQATRYKNIAGHIRTTQAILLFLKWQNLETLTSEVGGKLREVERQVAGKTSDVTALNSEVERLQEGLNPLRQKEVEASAAFSRVRIELEGLENEEKSIQARIEEFKSRLNQLDQDLSRETSFLGDSEQTLKRQKEEQETLQRELQTDQENSGGIEEDYRAMAAKTQEAEAQFNTINSTMTGKKIRTQHLEADLETLKARRERLKAEEAAAREELSILKPAQDDGQKSDRSLVDATLKNLKAAEEEFSATETKRLAAQETYETAREIYSEAKAGLGAIEGEISALEAMLIEDTPTGQVPIAKALSVENGYETALSAALGDDLEATEGNEGNHTWHALGALQNTPALPGGAKPLSDFIKGPAALARRLSQVGIVEDGAKLMAELLPGQRLVSKEGTLWRWDGLVRTSKAPTREAIKILQKNKLKTMKAKQQTEGEALAKLEATFASSGEKLGNLKEAENSARAKVQEATSIYKIERDKISEAEEETLKATERSAALTEALGRLAKDIEEDRDKIVTLETEIEMLGQAGKEEQEFEAARENLENLRENLAKARTKFEAWSQIRGEKEERLERLTREAGAWAERASAAQNQIQELKERKSTTAQQLSELAKTPDQFEERRVRLMDQMAKAEEACSLVREALAAKENNARHKDQALKEAQAALAEIREGMVRFQAQQEGAVERKAEVEHEIREEFDANPGDLLDTVEVTDKQREKLADAEAAEMKLERLKAERERLGAVNLRADVELEELTGEVARLTGERDDLQSAINKLRYNIGQLNREGRQKMLEAFEEVNKTFGELFEKTFQGGHAHLVLTESDDPLEAGLDIMAAPPGKKLLHRSLLSGGEQALTAITLIFAVFLTNPAPVCVLDEVDAPLDDANVERFCDLLDEIKGRTSTRFLIVTHNAISMARMERLYGVTMAEQGISQLVSVDLDDAQEMQATA